MIANTMEVKEYKKKVGKAGGKTEHQEQVDVFKWADTMGLKDDRLKLLFAVPNGAFYGNHWSIGVKMKKEGLKSGVPDIFLPVPMGEKHGLFIEMKAGKGRPSKIQNWWIQELHDQGYKANVCYGATEAITLIEKYLKI